MKSVAKKLNLDGEDLNLENLIAAAYNLDTRFKVNQKVRQKILKSRQWVERIEKERTLLVYGINTGFGSKATVSISQGKLKKLQRNLIMSHAAGTGEDLPIEVVRAAMLLRINTFAKGYSGVRLELIDTLIQMLEKGVVPWIPEQGSLGASGDLAPLSHLGLVLSRGVKKDREEQSGLAYFFNKQKARWQLTSGKTAMKKAGIPRLILEAKEGLALTNGTQISTAILALALFQARQLVKQADIAMAMSLEALQGISSAFREELHTLRPHPGQLHTARNIRHLIKGSKLIDLFPERVQDAYSLRCHPQVLAGVRSALDYIQDIIHIEINSTTDNPVIIPGLRDSNKALSGGNFHAQPIAFAADLLSMVLCEVGSIAERRIFRLSDKNLSHGLPSFLIENSGLESGLMMAQYTAAALVSENKSLAHPASIDSIPTCENQEDFVSMAPIAARKATAILKNVQKIVAIEIFYATQALDLRIKQTANKTAVSLFGRGTMTAYQEVRKKIPFISSDQPLYPYISAALDLVQSNEILQKVEKKIGKLD
jgi:histidine ammonia-lyase